MTLLDADASTATSQARAAVTDDPLRTARLVSAPRPGRWLAAAAVVVLVAMFVNTLITNQRFQWGIVAQYFTAPSILRGLGLTLALSASVFVVGYLFGIGLAAMRLSSNPILRSVSFTFVWIVRSVPAIVQVLFWFQLASLYPRLSIGIPFGPEFASVQTANLFSGIIAAFIALTLDVAAFSAEVVRGGLLSVDRGQTEAAEALGLSRRRIFRRIVLPQAMPAIIPASGNLANGMVKATAIVSVIAVQDLLYSAQLIYNDNFQVVPLLIVATLWYIIITTALSVLQYFIERHYNRSHRREVRSLREVFRSGLPLLPYRSKGARIDAGVGA